MIISELWLREWINPPLTASQLAAQLTMAGLEVDAISPVAGSFKQVIVAKVLSTKPHPQADKLTLCQIDTGSAIIPVVCGARNVRANLMVALAIPGATLPGGITIKETKLRGEPSHGMLCSEAELGLSESSEGIIELPQDAPIGEDIRVYLQLDDHILDINLTPNRADCMSVLGVAREVAAFNRMPLLEKKIGEAKVGCKDSLAVKIEAQEACPNYVGRIIKNINPTAENPLWLKERLRRSGLRSVHPVVDVTNYVMLALGQPMHAFDCNKIEDSIVVRFSQKNESLLLLDDQEVILKEKTLVIADKEKPLAIAGIMGGLLSAGTDETTSIFLESAFFNPISIAGIARSYGLTTDSSQRFERGVDPSLQMDALHYATELLLTIVGGEAGPITQNSQPGYLKSKKEIIFNPSLVKKLTGVAIPDTEIEQILCYLGMDVEKDKTQWVVTIPNYRFDVNLDVDLVEEVIRVNGYDNIEQGELLSVLEVGKPNPLLMLTSQAVSFLVSRGYHEVVNYSFVDPDLQHGLHPDCALMRLKNPISSELSDMRVSLWSGLLASTLYNTNRQQTSIKFFESGVVFKNEADGLEEIPMLAGLLYGDSGHLNWSEHTRRFDFFDAKGDLEALFSLLNIKDVEFISGINEALHPGQSAKMMKDGHCIGWIGVLHPKIASELDLVSDVVLFELSLNPLCSAPVASYHGVSKFPQIRRDLSFLVSKDIAVADIKKTVSACVPMNWLKAFHVFDLYTGESIPKDKKSIAIALIIQNNERTLVDVEINDMISGILKSLSDEFSIILRD